MADRISRERRSWNMSRIRGENTRPERAVRSLLHRMGFRFRLHRRDLPGTPDIVLPKYRTVVFVHGCYWHRHPGCRYAYTPKSRVEFWKTKFSQNVKRDVRVRSELEALGWNIVVVWECELQDSEALAERLRQICVVCSG
jgi:DNA mismatch endonuclease (patch repair protein)